MNILTGIETSPNESVPDPMEWAAWRDPPRRWKTLALTLAMHRYSRALRYASTGCRESRASHSVGSLRSPLEAYPVIDERRPELDAYRQTCAIPAAPPSPSGGTGRRRAPGRRRPPVRGPEARGAEPALRPPARAGRHAQELGGAQGTLDPRRGEAPRGPRRGPPARVRRLRGRDSRRQLRRRLGDRVGPRLVPLVQARGSRSSSTSAARSSSSSSASSCAAAGRWCAWAARSDKEWLLLKKAGGGAGDAGGRSTAIRSR